MVLRRPGRPLRRGPAPRPAVAGDIAARREEWTTVEGSALTKDEAASLQGALAAAGGAGPAALRAARENAPRVMRAGLAREAKDLAALEGAMLVAEQAHLSALQSGLAAGAGGAPQPPPLAGGGGGGGAQGVKVWQPVFASAGGFPRLLYIPVPEYFDLSRSLTGRPRGASERVNLTGTVDVITELGPFTTHFLGTCSWVDERTWEYWVERCRVEGPWGVKFTVPFRLHNTLTFFYLDAEAGLAAARSRIGGTMLLAADPEGARKYL